MTRLHAPAVGLLTLFMLGSGCAARHGRPIVGGTVVPNPSGTISGNVTTVVGIPVEGRRVTAIEMATDQHYDVTTASNGGYTIKVPPGRYRVELELWHGDQLVRRPEPTHVNVGDLDELLNFVISP